MLKDKTTTLTSYETISKYYTLFLSVRFVTSRYSSSYAILDHLSCPPWYYYTGLDSCTGQFTKTYCTSKLYIQCGKSTYK